jgi:hypothetical protein
LYEWVYIFWVFSKFVYECINKWINVYIVCMYICVRQFSKGALVADWKNRENWL